MIPTPEKLLLNKGESGHMGMPIWPDSVDKSHLRPSVDDYIPLATPLPTIDRLNYMILKNKICILIEYICILVEY